MKRCIGKNLTLAVNNILVNYNDEGPDNAEVILFLHGFPFNKSMWDMQMENLKEDYRVIAYDIRGHGSTEAGNDDFSIDIFANDLIGFMDKLELKKVILCGLSMGGYIALNAIARYAHSFGALVLCDTQCTADLPEVKEKRKKAIEGILKDGVEKYVEDSIPNLFASESLEAKKQEIDAIREIMKKTSAQTLCATLQALAERNETCSKLSAIEVPVLVIVGKEDKITPPAASRQMQERIQGAHLSIIAHAGHLTNIENPNEFNTQLKQFLHHFTQEASGSNVSVNL